MLNISEVVPCLGSVPSFRAYLCFGVQLSLLGGELFLETLDLVSGVGKNVLHFSLVVGVDLLKLKLLSIKSVKQRRDVCAKFKGWMRLEASALYSSTDCVIMEVRTQVVSCVIPGCPCKRCSTAK